MRRRIPAQLIGVLAVLAAAASFAQTAPSTSQGVEHLKATITGVEGIAQVRAADGQPWQRAAIGMELGEDAELRTGPRSAIKFVIPPDHTVIVDRLGSIKLLQAVNDNGMTKTSVGMKFGRTQYEVQAGGRAHEATIVSPSETLAVRGTNFVAYDQRPFAAEAISLQNRVEVRDFKKRVFIGGPNAGKTVVTTDNPNAPATALGQAVVDPGARYARSAAEEQLVNTLLSSGATVSFDFEKGIRVIRGGKVPQTDAQLIPTLPGNYNFVLRWQGNTDLNLAVGAINSISPAGETLYPIAGLDTTPSGGRILFDHRGGANGGIEVGFWPQPPPADTSFQFGSVLISGSPTPATLDVFHDGQRVPFIGPDGNATTTARYTAQPVPPSIASGQAVGILRLSSPVSAPSATQRPAAAARAKR